MAAQFITPVGRIVEGSLSRGNTTNMAGEKLVYKSGPNQGEPRLEYYFMLAIHKSDPSWPAFAALVQAEALAAWPGGQSKMPTFSWKIVDGDGVDHEGKPRSARTGQANHWLVKFTGSFAPKCYSRGGTNEIPATEIKAGYFVRVAGNTEGNKNATKPGMYMNYSMVELIGYGEEIQSGPDAKDAFGNSQVGYVPPGMTNAPPAGGGTFAHQASQAAQPAQPATNGFGGTAATTQAAPANAFSAPANTGAPAAGHSFLNPGK